MRLYNIFPLFIILYYMINYTVDNTTFEKFICHKTSNYVTPTELISDQTNYRLGAFLVVP